MLPHVGRDAVPFTYQFLGQIVEDVCPRQVVANGDRGCFKALLSRL